MKFTTKKLAAMAALVLAGVWALCWMLERPRINEPTYRGKGLTYWLKRLDDGQGNGISSGSVPTLSPPQLEAANAIRAIGTNALPILMRDIHSRPSEKAFNAGVRQRLNTFIQRFTRGFLLFDDFTPEDRIRWRAAEGLAALGPLASPAIPELNRLLLTNYFHSSIKESAYVLSTVGPEGIAILTNAPQHDEWSGMCAIWALGQHPAAGTNCIPFLVGATTSTSEGTACGAIQVLGMLRCNSEQVVPALAAALSDRRAPVRRDAASALGEYRAQARSAIPQLSLLTNDPAVRSEAEKALNKIGH
ncbi:MAG TPA: HEAT repeat domain-containing protein [Candidatus Dormibacteraeota bacterium]|nr:HEAT repeat domain-containing protein [Candidatus Dormibacteraeota bacterium]